MKGTINEKLEAYRKQTMTDGDEVFTARGQLGDTCRECCPEDSACACCAWLSFPLDCLDCCFECNNSCDC